MLRTSAELEDVPLGDAEMFEKFPRRMRRAFGTFATQGDREVLDGVVEGQVSLSAAQQFDEMFAKGAVWVFGHGGLLKTSC